MQVGVWEECCAVCNKINKYWESGKWNSVKAAYNEKLFVGTTEIMHDTENLTVVEHCHDPGEINALHIMLMQIKSF